MSTDFTLKDGSKGTKAEAIAEAIRALERQKLEIEEQLAALRRAQEGRA